jgi:alpha-glucosidase
VPLPWSGEHPPFGFGPAGSTPWLPQPPSWAELTVQAQRSDPSSMWTLYARALRLRRQLAALGAGELVWLSDPKDDALVFERPAVGDGPAVVCAINLGIRPAPAPLPDAPILASGPFENGQLPPDTAAWWTRA